MGEKEPKQSSVKRYTKLQGYIYDLYHTDYDLLVSVDQMVENLEEKVYPKLSKKDQKKLMDFLAPYKAIKTGFERQNDTAAEAIDPKEELNSILDKTSNLSFRSALNSVGQCTRDFVAFSNFLISLESNFEPGLEEHAVIREAHKIQLAKATQYLMKVPLVLGDIAKAVGKEKEEYQLPETMEEKIETARQKIEADNREINKASDKRNMLMDLEIENTGGLSVGQLLFDEGIDIPIRISDRSVNKAINKDKKRFFKGELFNWRRNQNFQNHLGLTPAETQQLNQAIKAKKQQHSYRGKIGKYNAPLTEMLKEKDVTLDKAGFKRLYKAARRYNLISIIAAGKAINIDFSEEQQDAIQLESGRKLAEKSRKSNVLFSQAIRRGSVSEGELRSWRKKRPSVEGFPKQELLDEIMVFRHEVTQAYKLSQDERIQPRVMEEFYARVRESGNRLQHLLLNAGIDSQGRRRQMVGRIASSLPGQCTDIRDGKISVYRTAINVARDIRDLQSDVLVRNELGEIIASNNRSKRKSITRQKARVFSKRHVVDSPKLGG